MVQVASLHTVPAMGSQLAMVWAKIQARTILTDPPPSLHPLMAVVVMMTLISELLVVLA